MDAPDKTRLTLAQVVSWIAWGRSFQCSTFRLAFETVNEQYSPQAAAALAEIQAAAGGFEFTTSLEDQLVDAEAALFDAIRAGRMTCFGKVDEREEAWQQVPADWFSPDNADPRPVIALLDQDWIGRKGSPPLHQIFGQFSRPNPNGWEAVQFEKGEMHAAFLPGIAKLWPTYRGADVEPTSSERPTTQRALSRPQKGGMGPTRHVLAAVAQLGAKLAAEGAPEPRDGGQARFEDWFVEVVANLGGEISPSRARVHVSRAIKLHREAQAKDR